MDGTRNHLVTWFDKLRWYSPQTELERVLAARRQPSTVEAYRRTWTRFARWASENDRDHFPVSADTLVDYLLWMKKYGLGKGEINRSLTVMRLLHNGHEDPTDKAIVREVVRGIRRLIIRETKKAHPISIAELEAMCVALASVGDGRALRDRALIAVGWCAAMRPSEIVHLNWEDVSNAELGIELTIRESKTCKDPNGELVALPLLSADHIDICPVRALRAVQTAESTGPIFTSVRKPAERLGSRSVERILSRASHLARLSIPVTGHSLRRGFATFAAHNGVTERALMRHGRWKTAAIMAGYVERARIWSENPVVELLG